MQTDISRTRSGPIDDEDDLALIGGRNASVQSESIVKIHEETTIKRIKD